ncbi:bifunctional nitrate reductase/sulfite reductase flavoprotein subunit alpha [Acinetobacter sp. MD2]|uniref:bifunctional nitrate reductase/sulfite reductase flavoprotein subunit alpha n=1 Tax=Acinetobacter sp. MD2 TaxID=2600066 RepID=UPI002D1EBF38|nr:bifunctional nitrate reductase/sulfite reductase flavoprotein subunit alpha [Acinetobacter sp. MD2]MEB3767818.1 molybdopterin-dependent oxidoreductase [Acinetobacter sp. MD2]
MAEMIKTVCPYCGVGCGMLLQVENKKVVKIIGDKNHPTNFGRLCTKGSSAHQALRHSGRMEKAYYRSSKDTEKVACETSIAISHTAQKLKQILQQHGADALSFYVSGQMSIEAQYLINKLAKGFIGTNNIESNSRLCMASAGTGYKLSLGADAPPGSYQDFDHADVFLVMGANMADCHPILFLRMMDRVKKGAKLIVVDPRKNATAEKADLFLQIKAGTDLYLLNGLLHILFKTQKINSQFIEQYTEGWAQMPDFLADYPPSLVAEKTGLSEAAILQAAEWIGSTQNFMSCWTMGLNQSTHGTWNTNAICNLHLATGTICRLGSGPFSLTGQPNAMGGREMGYMGAGLPGQRSVLSETDRNFIENYWNLPKGQLKIQLGKGTIDLFEQMQNGKIKACWIICTNPVASVANRQNVIAGLNAAEVVIAQDAFLDTETNRYADILLPAALWAEAEGVMINSERNMTLMQKAIDPPQAALADWQIISQVACEMGYQDAFNYSSAAEIFDEICGCSNPKTGYDLRGASYARLKETPLQWPCPPLDTPQGQQNRHPIRYLNDGVSQPLHPTQPALDLVFPTEHGKAYFFARPHLDPAEMPDDDYPFVLNTGRVQHQWHTLTKTGKIPTLNKLNAAPFLEIHPEDAKRLNISNQQAVEIRSRRGRAILPAVITNKVMQGNCFAPFHWNDVFGENLAINAVTSDAIDPLSQQPEFKICAVQLCPTTANEDNVFFRKSSDTNMPTKTAPPPPAIETSCIDTLMQTFGITQLTPTQLHESEKIYLAGYLSALQSSPPAAHLIPVLPEHAPFTSQHKLWVNGVLAGHYARQSFTSESNTTENIAHAAIENVLSQPNVTIVWASQTGNCESLAHDFADKIKASGIPVNCYDMNEFSVAQLQRSQYLLCISSTFGDGDAPDNGQGFWEDLNRQSNLNLNALQYSVLALGDPNYDQFCGHGKRLDQKLAELGASRIFDRIDCDTDFQEKAEQWFNQLLEKIPTTSNIAEQKSSSPLKPTKIAAHEPSKAQPFMSRLLLNQPLNQAGSNKDVRLFAFDIQNSGIQYQAGDALGVWPKNCPELVDELLSVTKLAGEQLVARVDLVEMPLRQALIEHFEIAKVPLKALQLIANKGNYHYLHALLDSPDKTELKKWLWGKQLVDILHEYPVRMSMNELLSVLPKLQPRLYSISSSSEAYPDQIHLTVSAVRYQQQNKQRKGVSSTFLADRATDETIAIFVQKSASFHPPQHADTPLIMVGPGTGVAPFRGFLQERHAKGHRGKNWLIFGEQFSATDFYYQQELEDYLAQGLLNRLDVAFSRDQTEKIYVQDRIREHGETLWAWLEQGAYFCICGDASRMAKDVDAALKEVVMQYGQMDAEHAANYVMQMSRDKRYLRDVY